MRSSACRKMNEKQKKTIILKHFASVIDMLPTHTTLSTHMGKCDTLAGVCLCVKESGRAAEVITAFSGNTFYMKCI